MPSGSLPLVAAKKTGATNIKEFVEYCRKTEKVSVGTYAAGSTAHLSAAQLEVRAGIKMAHVPYRGAMPALTDVLAGHVDLFFDTLATSVPLYKDGKVKLLGVPDDKRAPAAPDVPTFTEAGLPGFKSTTWFGLVAPPATPEALAARINADAVTLLRSAEVRETLGPLETENALLREVDWPGGDTNVIVVGHQPTLGRVAALQFTVALSV